MQFGYHHSSFHYEDDEPLVESVVERARLVEDAGFSWFSVMDHLWQIPAVGHTDEPFFDAYTILPAVARATNEIEVATLVTSVHYRNPALLAKTMATLDHVSGGRAVLGIGAGWYEAEYEAYGYEFPAPQKRISQLEDGIRLIEAVWTRPSPVTYHGRHYEVEDLVMEPKPLQEPRPPVLVGGGGEQLTLRVVARYADRWNVGGDPGTFEHKRSVLADHCEAVGRSIDEIAQTVVQPVVIREDAEAAHAAYEVLAAETAAGPTPRDEYRGLVGTVDDVIARLSTFEDLGVDTCMISPRKNDRESTEAFVDEVLPSFD